MEQYYYNHMNKPQQATYHSIFVGVKNLSDEIQVPALSGEELYNIFFQMRLDLSLIHISEPTRRS